MELKWNNEKIYSKELLKKISVLIKKNTNINFPLDKKGKNLLRKYSIDFDMPVFSLYSLRSLLRIKRMFFNFNFSNQIINELNNLTSLIEFKQKLYVLNIPIEIIIKKIKPIDEEIKEYINNENEKFDLSNKLIIKKANEFESFLEKYLSFNQIKFKTEKEIKEKGNKEKEIDILTPDILFDEPIILEINNEKHLIYWMDAKNYIFYDIPFIGKIKKQVKKYYDKFGLGALVFHYGFVEEYQIEGAIILDGSFLK